MNKRITSHLLTKDNDSLVLGRGNNRGQKVNIKALNALQQVPWKLNEDILHLLKDTLKSSDKPLTAMEESDRDKAYTLRNRETDVVADYLLENGNSFYFGYRYDKRGRSYSAG